MKEARIRMVTLPRHLRVAWEYRYTLSLILSWTHVRRIDKKSFTHLLAKRVFQTETMGKRVENLASSEQHSEEPVELMILLPDPALRTTCHWSTSTTAKQEEIPEVDLLTR